MRASYYFLGTGGNQEVSLSLSEKTPFFEDDWSNNLNSQDETGNLTDQGN